MSEQKTYQIQMTEYSENTINVSYISEEEYIRVKIDELLPSEKNAIKKVMNNRFIPHEQKLDVATGAKLMYEAILNHIKSKLTEK